MLITKNPLKTSRTKQTQNYQTEFADLKAAIKKQMYTGKYL